MLRPRICLDAAVLAVASLLCLPLQAADPITMVPADALGIVVVDRLDGLDVKVRKVGESLQLPLPGPFTPLLAVPGLSDCLDTDSPIVVALLKGSEAGDDPVPVGFVPVDDFEAFAKLFGGEAEGDVVRLTMGPKPMLAAEEDGCAVIVAEDKKAVLKRALKLPGGLAERLGDDLAWLNERDVAAVMTDAGISVFCEKILEGIEVAQQAIRAQGKDTMGAADILNVYKTMFAVVDQEAELIAVGLDVQESGDLVLQVRKRFLPAGRLAQCLEVPAAPSDMLAGLPGEPFVFAGGGQFSPAAGNLMMDFSMEVMKAAPKLYGISEEQADRMMESAEPIMADLQSLAMMLAVGSPGDTIYSRMVGVMRTADAAKYMEAYETYIQEFAELMRDSKGMFSMPMETKPIVVAGCKGVEISMELPKQLLTGEPNAVAMLEKMIGPGGKIRAFIVAADERNVLIGYTKKKLLRKAIAALRNGKSLSQDKSVTEATAKLDEANLGQGYFSPAGLVEFVNDMIETAAPEEQKGIQLPAFPETPPVAWSANAEGATVDAQIVVPGELIKAGIGYGAQVRQAFQPPKE